MLIFGCRYFFSCQGLRVTAWGVISITRPTPNHQPAATPSTNSSNNDDDMATNFHTNQRLSYDGALCTVRYIGRVGATPGEWLGVEWDDVLRGKHSGEHEGIKYFECTSTN